MEVVGVQRERDAPEQLDRVGAIPAVELREVRAEHRVLERGQHAIADVLVERHPAAERRGALPHPRAEHRVRAPEGERLDHRVELLRRVLAVAVHHHHVVEPLGEGVGVADLLIAAVPAVEAIA